MSLACLFACLGLLGWWYWSWSWSWSIAPFVRKVIHIPFLQIYVITSRKVQCTYLPYCTLMLKRGV